MCNYCAKRINPRYSNFYYIHLSSPGEQLIQSKQKYNYKLN